MEVVKNSPDVALAVLIESLKWIDDVCMKKKEEEEEEEEKKYECKVCGWHQQPFKLFCGYN